MICAGPRLENAPALQWIGNLLAVQLIWTAVKTVDGASRTSVLGYRGFPCDGVNAAGGHLCGNIWNDE